MRRTSGHFLLTLVAIAVVAAGCGSGATSLGGTGSGTNSPAAAASPSASAETSPALPNAVLRLTAKNIAFDQKQLTAAANTPIQIDVDNQENGTPHNVAIYTDQSATTAVFKGEIFPGPAQRTYDVPALKAGSYIFRCDVHPNQMSGTLVVQ